MAMTMKMSVRLRSAAGPSAVGAKGAKLRSRSSAGRRSSAVAPLSVATEKTQPLEDETQRSSSSGSLVESFSPSAMFASATAFSYAIAAMVPPEALAKGGEYGYLETRLPALAHPLAMGTIFAYTLYAGYLGWQWRRVRTVGAELAELKKSLPAEGSEQTASADLTAKIDTLSAERADLVKAGFREKHFNMGSLLLASGVFFSIEGGLNTYLRVGKLFPGPHLFAGASITILWALAAACVPWMQKGNDTARSLHIGLNAVNVALFAWQIPTGLEIVGKVFQFTKW